MSGLPTRFHVSHYTTVMEQLNAEYVRQAQNRYLFRLPDHNLFAVVTRSGETVTVNYYENEGDCGC